MANTLVRVLRAFNGINRDQGGEEKSRYFTPDNESTAKGFLSDEEFEYRKANGFLSEEPTPEAKPLTFRAPSAEAQAQSQPVVPAEPASRRVRRAEPEATS